ncbi:ABC transporter ATP-binding protein [Pseudomonas granadensis]|uniref:ABC transporter ATP-binding protein n=2 Tax=Pseudomonas granadensis TaxID=1421430 RepID=A0ABX7GBZ7_9PSED|nr:ABC transporter ATP-binding protein [Pseudomonas granadensis]MBN6775251.1 ABC transporter ATP-binding protein [Pseudomonas granadensis]MBN6806062.1 ABC transporter ATP-binding protein [Pseudomonas granadensis]MBN6833297.1 ABC transporter ATP-binding protein [Pseudomonas granadensis]MBN6840573.1 ABC transporter ATP-binding protein [Pseudomonas granadensis]MBN6869700.1 ABC transporter ATP-binding protein [Pseudomonas granadensis]
MSSEIAIKVQNLSKCYEIYDKPRDRLLQMLSRGRKKYCREFWALHDVSFEIRKGETVGIVGKNGSGKSTLLQILCGTLNPTGGTVETHGRIAALLELGSGFNPEFTGRENVYLNATILGLSKEEIDEKYDAIIEFADIGEFINQPVKTYSSGMLVRLAFSVQAQVEPDILIVDEALAVGDAKFQARCFDRLKKLKENGTSILLVTHSSEQIVTHCDKAFLLNDGVQLEQGEPRTVVNRYLDLLFGKTRNSVVTEHEPTVDAMETYHTPEGGLDVFDTHANYNPNEYRWGDRAATIIDFHLSADGQEYPVAVDTGSKLKLTVFVKFDTDLVCPILGMTIKTKEGVTVYGVNSETLDSPDFRAFGRKGDIVEVELSIACELAPGDYFISLGVSTKEGEEVTPRDRRYDSVHLQVRPTDKFFGLVNLDSSIRAKKVTN